MLLSLCTRRNAQLDKRSINAPIQQLLVTRGLRYRFPLKW
ncbi:MAG: hypothetical protein EWM72_02883 [Nitrospira sp.]|nr:MAG: hypothetical protein EWM72_02883 [Nitrospira sp.]